jgi:ankyrin repeat protein
MQTDRITQLYPAKGGVIPAASSIVPGEGNAARFMPLQHDVMPSIDSLPTTLLILIMQKMSNDPRSLIRLSLTCRQFQTIFKATYKIDKAHEYPSFAFAYIFSCDIATPAMCEDLYAILSNRQANQTIPLAFQVVIPDPYTSQWTQLKDHPVEPSLKGPARQTAIIQKFYIKAWDLLGQSTVLANKSQAVRLMRLLLDLLPYIHNLEEYAAKLFHERSPQKCFSQLAEYHVDRCLQLVVKHFNIAQAYTFITAINPVFRTHLIEQDALKDIKEGLYPSFLHYTLANYVSKSTAYHDFSTLLTLLFKQGCDLEQRNANAETALSYVLKMLPIGKRRAKYQKELISYLIEQGANCNVRDKEGNTPLIMMVYEKVIQRSIISFLLQYPQVNVNARNKQGVNALEAAIQRNILPIVQTLLADPRVDVNAKNKEGDSPLHGAIKHYSSLPIVQALLANPNIDVNATDNEGNSLLHIAIKYHRLPIIKALLEDTRTEVNAKDNQGDSALHEAIKLNILSVVQALLTHPKIHSATCLSAFNYVIKSGKNEIITIFLQGMDRGKTIVFIKQAIDLAKKDHQSAVVSKLDQILRFD